MVVRDDSRTAALWASDSGNPGHDYPQISDAERTGLAPVDFCCVLRPIANVLTTARLAAVIPFAILLAGAGHHPSWAAAAVFAVASLTDYLDGYLARHAHRPSRFGRIVDPLADRLLINMALVLLWYEDRLPWWLAAPVLGRDIWLALLFRMRRMSSNVPVNMTGKTATAVIMLALVLVMVVAAPWPQVLIGVGLVLSLAAGARYTRRPREA
jgi:CDP-diacylglycerol--glycerol-3-phosphate 3-phosphatidyltransferase